MHSSGPGWLFIVIAAALLTTGLVCLIRPNSTAFSSRNGLFRQANNWQYNDNESNDRSPAGLALIRFIGCFFVIVGIGLLVTGIRSI
jgi:hypothetical protein